MVEITLQGEIETGRSEQVRKNLEKLLSNMQKNTLDVAELLFEVKQNGYFQKWGHESFKHYLVGLDIKTRKAQYLVRIIDVMAQLGIARSKYEPVGISKLREICSLEPNETYTNPTTQQVTPMSEFITGFIERHNELGLEEIKQHVRTLKGLTGENELVWMNFCMKKSVKDEVVKPALELAKANIGSVGSDDEGNAIDASDGKALEVVAIEYLNDPANRPLEEEIG